MIKVAADIISNAQHSPMGILSTTGSGGRGAIVTGAVGAAAGLALAVISGWVFDIFTGIGFGGSGNTLMRAVSLFSGVVAGAAVAGAGAGGGAVTGTGAGAAVAVPIGRGKGVFDAGPGGGGGANVRGAGTLGAGGFGSGTCDTGGRGIGTLPGLGTRGTDVGGSSDVGGRAGKLIMTVSSSWGAPPSS
jgi:hypothetical protein